MGIVVDQPFAAVECRQRGVVEPRLAAAKAHLGQPRAGADQDREGARAHLDVERPPVTGRDNVEFLGAVGDDAGEDVEAAGGRLRVGRGGKVFRQLQAFHQRDDVDAAGLQHGAIGEAELVQRHVVEPVGDDRSRAPAESSRAPGRRFRRGGGRGSPAGPGRGRADARSPISPVFDHGEDAVGGKDAVGFFSHSFASNQEGSPVTPAQAGVYRNRQRKDRPAPRWIPASAGMTDHRLPQPAIDAKFMRHYEETVRGHLSRPACSHVKQIAKRPEGMFPTRPLGPGFLLETGHGEESRRKRQRRAAG